RLEGRARGFGGTPTVIRYKNAVDAVFEAQPRVLARVHPLDEEFPLPEFTEPIGESPVHGRIRVAHAGHVDTVVHRAFPDGGTGRAFVAGGALTQVLRARAQVGLAVAAGSVIDRESDHRASGGFHAPQELFAGVPGARRVKLIP